MVVGCGWMGDDQLLMEEFRAGQRAGIQIVCEEQGPGMCDRREILEAGEASAVLTHVGLAGIKRLMDDLEIESQVGLGTTIRARRWLS